MLDRNIDQLLDICLDRLNAGENVERILVDYPEDAARLRPLLQTAVQTSRTYRFRTDAETKQSALDKFNAALVAGRERRRVRQPWYRHLLRPAVLAGAATVVVGLLIVFASVQTVFSPGSSYQVSPVKPVASPDGNFVFLISDEVNAIAEFSSVPVYISKIGLQQEDGKWIEIPIEPAVSVDLTKVPGDAVQQVWQGDIPQGTYHQVFVYVDNVSGVLIKDPGKVVEIKLPSNRLHLSIPFTTSNSVVTSFTYDMTVFATSNGKNTKYMLKPQIGESGASEKSQGNSNKEKSAVTPERPVNTPATRSKAPKK
jgi:hypothetical protein